MITSLLFIAVASLAPAQNPPAADLAERTRSLMPVPRSVVWGSGRLVLDSTFTAGIAGFWDERLDRAMGRMLARLRGRTAISMSGTPQNERPATLSIRAAGAGQRVQGVDEDESYRLTVTPSGATLEAATVVGVMRGLETFLQLVGSDAQGFHVAEARIEDSPRFPWRGLLVDVSRHFMPPEVVKRTLDGMAAVKLNVLHWHLSEDQGFRVESRRHPRLHQQGSDGLYYTQDQVRDIVAYARDRGIRVVPEFDMPGHTQSWLVGYPELSAGPGPYQIERRFGVFDPVMDPTREEVYRFLDGFIGEMVTLFPDTWFHIGGDEVNGVQWNANPRITEFKQARGFADNEALHAYFNQRVLRILSKYRRQMIGWDEILHPELPTSIVIQSWRGTASLVRGAQSGYGGILSAPYYLDHQNSAEYHYLQDPLPEGSGLTPEQETRIYGGEACMWAEHVTPETIDSRIWPRMAAVAERFWSPREVRDVPDMYRRLAITSVRLEELGLTHEAHTARMIRRIVPPEATPLVELLRWVMTPSFGERGQLMRPTQLTPLTTIVDAARPDPPGRWYLVARLAQLQAGDTTALAPLSATFGAWAPLVPYVTAIGRRSPVAAAAVPAAEALVRAGALGQAAIDTLRTGRKASVEWTAAQLATLQQLQRPQGFLRLAVVDQIRRLVLLAGEAPAPTTGTPR